MTPAVLALLATALSPAIANRAEHKNTYAKAAFDTATLGLFRDSKSEANRDACRSLCQQAA